MNHIPAFSLASCADGRGFPRVEQALPHDISPPPPGGSLAKFMAVFRANGERVRQPGHLHVTLENKGSRWPDFIGGHNLDSYGLLASVRVLETLRREGIGGFTPIPVEFVRMPAKLSTGETPRYHALRPETVLPQIIHVFQHDEGTLTPLGRYPYPGPKPEALGWTLGRCSLSQPLNRPKDENVLLGGAFRGFFCSRKIAEIAFREKWTNLQFRAFDALHTPGIDGHYLARIPSDTGSMDGPWYTELQGQAWRLAGFGNPT
jgi:hypothetical protein